MTFPETVKTTLWDIIDEMSLSISSFVNNPDKDFLLYRKVLTLGLLDMKSARKLAGTTNKRQVLEDIEAFSTREVFTELIVFV